MMTRMVNNITEMVLIGCTICGQFLIVGTVYEVSGRGVSGHRVFGGALAVIHIMRGCLDEGMM